MTEEVSKSEIHLQKMKVLLGVGGVLAFTLLGGSLVKDHLSYKNAKRQVVNGYSVKMYDVCNRGKEITGTRGSLKFKLTDIDGSGALLDGKYSQDRIRLSSGDRELKLDARGVVGSPSLEDLSLYSQNSVNEYNQLYKTLLLKELKKDYESKLEGVRGSYGDPNFVGGEE